MDKYQKLTFCRLKPCKNLVSTSILIINLFFTDIGSTSVRHILTLNKQKNFILVSTENKYVVFDFIKLEISKSLKGKKQQ